MYPEILSAAEEKAPSTIGPAASSAKAWRGATTGRSATASCCRSASRRTGTQDFTFTIRGIYKAGGSAVDNQSMLFHWKYADERSLEKGQVGWYVVKIGDPGHAPQISAAIDQQFANTPYETKTDTEKAFQSSFASMFGNLNLLLGSIAPRRRRHDAVRGCQHDGDVGARAHDGDCRSCGRSAFRRATIFLLVAGEGC